MGRFTRQGQERGFLSRLGTDRFLVFDYLGAVFTSLNGINSDGLICDVTTMVPAWSMGSWRELSPVSKRASRAQLLAARLATRGVVSCPGYNTTARSAQCRGCRQIGVAIGDRS